MHVLYCFGSSHSTGKCFSVMALSHSLSLNLSVPLWCPDYAVQCERGNTQSAGSSTPEKMRPQWPYQCYIEDDTNFLNENVPRTPEHRTIMQAAGTPEVLAGASLIMFLFSSSSPMGVFKQT